MRIPQPFFRNARNAWFLQLGKRQINLGPDRDEALKQYHRLMLQEGYTEPDELAIADLVSEFLAWSKDEHEPDTTDWYTRFLQDFSGRYGHLKVANLKRHQVRNWYSRQSWKQATRRCAIVCIRRVLNWAIDEGLLKENPLPTLKAPAATRRERILNPEEQTKILAAAAEPFRTFYWAMLESGARPGEVARVSRDNLQGDTWVFDKHKTAKSTGKPRVVYLTPPLAELCRKLAEQYPEGPLFRNRYGEAWTRNAIGIRFRNLRRKLKLNGVVAYTCRHTFCTEGLENEVPIATMSELLGHTSTRMMSHYNHLAEKRDHLRQSVLRARGHAVLGGGLQSGPSQ
jgi:integrase